MLIQGGLDLLALQRCWSRSPNVAIVGRNGAGILNGGQQCSRLLDSKKKLHVEPRLRRGLKFLQDHTDR
jgi:hypothetical protein